MKKLIILFLLLFGILNLSSCDVKFSNNTNIETKGEEMLFKINDEIIDVVWENNASVEALKEYAKTEITISMHKYGGFEQVGSIGKTLPSNDTNIKTKTGDIVLYSSNQLVVFYGSNSWDYTRLGHINLSDEKIIDLLSNENVTIKISVK